jgi:hypothetical protein
MHIFQLNHIPVALKLKYHHGDKKKICSHGGVKVDIGYLNCGIG